MTPIYYFRLQAKNLLKDQKTQYVYEVAKDGTQHYTYKPKYFNVDGILLDFDIYDEDPISLMRAQHIIAMMLGFKKWSDLINAPEIELEYAKLRFENQAKISLGDWEDHMDSTEAEFGELATEDKIAFFKHSLSVAEQEGIYGGFFTCYLLDENMRRAYANKESPQVSEPISDVQITSLPLSNEDRAYLIDVANRAFEDAFERIEPNHPEETRKLWDAGAYVDAFIGVGMLPIGKNYAAYQIDAVLVHHVIGLAVQADKALAA